MICSTIATPNKIGIATLYLSEMLKERNQTYNSTNCIIPFIYSLKQVKQIMISESFCLPSGGRSEERGNEKDFEKC